MTIAIRQASSSDAAILAPLLDAYRQFYGQPGDLPRAREWLRERLERGESVVLVAERPGVPVGFAQLFPTFSSVRTARVWILNDLFVSPQARRAGVARSLLDAAAGFARQQGAAYITLETMRDNAAARALYRAAGWHEEETQWYTVVFGSPASVNDPTAHAGAPQDPRR